MRPLLICLALLATPVAAQPILDVSRIPAPARAAYERFLTANVPRAAYISPAGKIGWYSGTSSTRMDDVRARAEKLCVESGGSHCTLYAENLDVVAQSSPPDHGPAPPGSLVSGDGYSFVPDDRYFWHGPQTARGLYVWSHGRGPTDSRGLQPQPHVRFFNNAGFDVVRFDRNLAYDDVGRVSTWLHQGLAELRRRGWTFIIAGGQSRGAWNSLQVLDTPGLADAVIAISPAARGEAGGALNLGGSELWSIAHDAKSLKTRVVIAQFTGDPYAGDLDNRAEMFSSTLRTRTAGLLIIDRPTGFTGHYGGSTALFNEKFGACLLRFVTDASANNSC